MALDRSDYYKMSEDLRKISITDSLTDLYNRRFFQDRISEEIERSRRHGLPVSLIMLDIDNFKQHNHTCGHLAGDEALRLIAATFTNSVRNIDRVTRYGGEEFAVILPMTEIAPARRQSKDLDSARQFASLYNFELTEGGLQIYFCSLLHSAQLTVVERLKALEFLHYCAHAPLEFAALHYLKGRELSEGVDFEAILNALASLGLIDYRFGMVSALHDPVLKDGVVWNFSHKVSGSELARVQFDLASGLLRKFWQTRQSRPQTDILKTIQAVFEAMNCQSVALGWFRYAQHARPEAALAVQKAIAVRGEEMFLPEVISVSVPRNLPLAGCELSGELVLARGFDQGIYSDDTETA